MSLEKRPSHFKKVDWKNNHHGCVWHKDDRLITFNINMTHTSGEKMKGHTTKLCV
jgi:hypothetical protein